jgi:hypothetical protein
MTRAPKKVKLKRGKETALLPARLKRLRQENEIWEADFRALPKPMSQNETHYLGMVVAKKGGTLLAKSQVETRPTVIDLATLLAQAMRRPLSQDAHRPSQLRVRGHPQWKELFPHLNELGIRVSVYRELPKSEAAYREYLRREQEAHRIGRVKPTSEQASVEKLFPAIARYVDGCGYIEIGEQESFGFVARAIGYGGVDFEDDRPHTLAEALAVLEKGLAEKFQAEGVDLD